MKSAGSQSKVYAEHYPIQLREMRAECSGVESGLVLGLYALLRAAGMRITYGETDVLSGQAACFHYSLNRPECVNLSFVPPVDTLFKSLDITWKEVTPSGPRTAFEVLKRWIDTGKIALARLKEPLLIYGYAENSVETKLLAARLNHRLEEVMISISECDKLYWRYPLDEGNLLIQVEEAPTLAPELFSLSKLAARRAAAAWHADSLAGIATGNEAYARLSEDLKGDAVFTKHPATAWLGLALWSQWNARMSSHSFFLRMAPRFGGDERHAMDKAAFFYAQCVDAWRRFERLIGPTWNVERHGFDVEPPSVYLERWQNPETRLRAAKWVDEAAGWEAKAVGSLVKLLN